MNMYRLAFSLLACLSLCSPIFANGRIQVIIPAKAPSRAAHFNWTFKSADGRAPLIGQFACGSYWVAPATGDRGVKLVSLTGNPKNVGNARDLLSCDADPITERHGLLSGKNRYGSQDPTRNLLSKLPVLLRPKKGSCISLVAAMQRNEAATSKAGTRQICGEATDAYCMVTVMPKPPKNGGKNMIRPNIIGATKEFLTWDDFDLTRLPKIGFLEGRSGSDWENVARRWRSATEIFSLVAEAHSKRYGRHFRMFSEAGRAFRAHLVVHDYGSGTARGYNGDLLAMFAASSRLEEMKPALAAMIAYGLDLYHARYNHGTNARKGWSCGAGQWVGQFMPPVFAASLLKDTTKANRLRRAAATNFGDDRAERGPQEIRQIKRGRTGVLLWGDGHPIVRPKGRLVLEDWIYWADMKQSKCYDSYSGSGKANPNQGKKNATDPYGYTDGPANKPGSAYMHVSFGPFRSFASVMILMPAVRSVVNTDAPIEYVDRVVRHGLWTWPDPVASPASVDQDTVRMKWSAADCKEWRKTWGPSPKDIRFAIEDGIEDGKGRFKSSHGKKFNKGKGGYECAQVLKHWNKIIAMYDGQKYEDNLVNFGEVVAPGIILVPGAQPQAYLSCATPDAVIHYTTDGSKPTSTSPVYNGKPVTIGSKTVVRAVAILGKRKSKLRQKSLAR